MNEDYVARFNRVRERWERWLQQIAPVASPRWGFSIFGMALVSAAMGFFGSGDMLETVDWFSCAILFLFVVGVAAMSARDWRRTLAATLAFAWLFLVASWAAKLAHEVLSNRTLGEFEVALAVAFGPIALICHAHKKRRAHGLSECVAAESTIVAAGSSIILPGFGVASLLLAAWIGGFVPLWPALTFVASPFAALLVYPAGAAVLETMFARRVPIEKRYKFH